MNKKHSLASFSGIALLAAVLLLGAATPARAVGDVFLTGANAFSDLDDSDGLHDGVFNVSGNLVLQPGASILCNDSGPSTASACPISIVVGGGMTMFPGSSILAENNVGGGSGGNIRIVVQGFSFYVAPTAVISSRKNAATDRAGAGNIFIAVGSLILNGDTASCDQGFGDVGLDSGSLITSDGNGEAGSIRIFSGATLVTAGTVRAQGLTTTGRGGAIALASCGGLGVAPGGVVSSRGGGPGADLVFLQGGAVSIHGLVESTGPGQEAPRGRNLCNDPGRPVNSTACVLVAAAGGAIDVFPEAEISADTGFAAGTQGTGWIDVQTTGNITIVGDANLPFALHANQGLTNGHGGTILVRTTGFGKTITLWGKAIQANSTTGGGKGGNVFLESTFGSVDLGQASVQAQGSLFGGGSQAGGHITVNAFLGDIDGSLPGEVSARGGFPSSVGFVSMNFCHAFNYTGLSIPSASVTQICAGL